MKEAGVPCVPGSDGLIDSYDDAVKIAEKADVVVCVIGDCLAQNGEYRDRADLELSGYQTELVKRLIDTKKPVIAVLVNCKPLCISYLK